MCWLCGVDLYHTGTHGSSMRTGNLAAFVTSMRIVTGTGEVRSYSVNCHLIRNIDEISNAYT